MKIVRLSKDSNLNRIEKVFKWTRFSGRGPAGTIPTLDSLDEKAVVVAADLALVGDSEDSFSNKKSTWQQIIDSVLTTAFNLIYAAIFNIQNHGTISGATTFNATTASTHTADFTADFTATFTGFTSSRQSIRWEFVVSGGGSPTVTVAGAIFKFMKTLNLTNLADGDYQVVVNSSDSGTNAKIYVTLAP